MAAGRDDREETARDSAYDGDRGYAAEDVDKNVEASFQLKTCSDLDEFAGHGTPLVSAQKEPLWEQLIWEGGQPVDAFLTAASAQVGQVILNLPNSMAKLGLTAGIFTQVLAASAAVYTLYLLNALYHEFKRHAVKTNTWFTAGGNKRDVVTQYHGVVLFSTGQRWLSEFSRVVNVVELLGLSIAQIIASASNFYSLGTGLSKRDFTFIFGSIACLMVLIPTFRNMRLFVILALIGTTYTSWYMIITSAVSGLQNGAASQPPGSLEDIFAAVSNILFTFGGHCMLLEVLDSQFKPSKFPKAFAYALLYVTSTLTLPNAIFTFLAFPAEAYQYGNAFAIFPNNPAKSVGIVLMVAHQLVAYGLFILPVCYMLEKLFRVHTKAYLLRVAARLPAAGFTFLIALMLPFFGVINDLLGAFCVSFETYIIPCVAFEIYYWSAARREQAVIKPRIFAFPVSWTFLRVINVAIILGAAVCGLGFGGYASVTALIASIDNFGLFAECYNC